MAGAAADSLLVIGRIPQDATVRLGMVEAMLHDACDALPEIASIVLNRGFAVVAFEAPPPAAVLGERKLSVKLGGATEQVLVVLERVPRGEEPAAVAARLNSDGKASPRPRSARGKAGASLTALQIDSTSPRADEGEGGSTSRKKARLGASSAPLNAQLSPPETPLDTDGQPSKQVGGARLNRHGLSYRCSRCGQPKKGHNCGLDGGGTPPVLAQPLVIGGFSMMAGVAPMAAACYVPVQQLGAGAAQSVPFAYQLAAPPLGAQLSAGVARSARGAGGSSNAGATARGASAPPLGAPAIGELSEMDLMLADLAFAAVHASGKAAASAVPGAVGVGRPPPVVTPDDAILPGPLGGANGAAAPPILACAIRSHPSLHRLTSSQTAIRPSLPPTLHPYIRASLHPHVPPSLPPCAHHPSHPTLILHPDRSRVRREPLGGARRTALVRRPLLAGRAEPLVAHALAVHALAADAAHRQLAARDARVWLGAGARRRPSRGHSRRRARSSLRAERAPPPLASCAEPASSTLPDWDAPCLSLRSTRRSLVPTWRPFSIAFCRAHAVDARAPRDRGE
jgi:hypothetical protein